MNASDAIDSGPVADARAFLARVRALRPPLTALESTELQRLISETRVARQSGAMDYGTAQELREAHLRKLEVARE